ncbi:threonine aldolase family protein [Jiulongibacter sediminis]|uniref:Threonine aldolase n=1 Tax=Jiulongibacter sediminis TaxID=1605367 RepID=A0A0P7C8V2_9BACT|nr:GntG family PLP-dependent aldolase [Jiulongibacter sediminis]KPM50174.1 threonine aldolase [Jiulongibacter sediminis]TBX27189.1 threonine aldolase [Jiulongibacter sediminis]
MTADFRSDTITRPTPAMLEQMLGAKVGDDVFGDDPTVNALEEKVARLFGMEAALFTASGTMANQLAIKCQTQPGEEVICDELSHVYLYEAGGIAANAGCSVRLLHGDRGRITADMVKSAMKTEDIHFAMPTLVSLENTMNKGGGAIYNFEEIKKISSLCQQNGLKLHLDGARLFNALVETNETPEDYGQVFDSISVCLSKGLGCPVGSLLIGSKYLIKKARKQRKTWGGGWRQAGILAAAGIYALDYHVERLKEDHRRAKELGEILKPLPFVKSVYPIETNIVIFELQDSILATDFVRAFEKIGIKTVTFGKHLVRFVTHLEITDDHLSIAEKALKN